MTTYQLQSTEAVVLRASSVKRGAGLGYFNGELVLTNLHLIWIGKGFLGNTKKVEYLPLANVKVFNDQAQALLGKSRDGRALLEIFFQNGHEAFGFQSGGKRVVGQWIDAINEVVTTDGTDAPTPRPMALPGAGWVGETLRDTMDEFKGALSRRQQQRQVAACSSCGTSLSGREGAVVKCPACGTKRKLV